MSLTETEIVLCNQALDRIGAKNFTVDHLTVEAVRCNTIYEQTRDVLLRSFEWPFAMARKALSSETATPDFEWDYKFRLPDDFLRLKADYTVDDGDAVGQRFTIEGNYLLTNDDEAEIRYIKKITDPEEFDPLFAEILVLTLAKKLIVPLANLTKNPYLALEVNRDLMAVTVKARAVCRAETNTTGQSTWNLARYGNGKV